MIYEFQYDNGIKIGAMDFGGDVLIFEEKNDGFKSGVVGFNREEAIAAARAILKHYNVGIE